MLNTLFIPFHVRQLYLDKASPIASASTDFSQAPYYDKQAKRIVNNDNPFISENMVNEPFEDDLHNLEAGNHLHFILPAPFTHFANKGTHNLPAPNRWLVSKGKTKVNNSNPVEYNYKYNWIVESDYLSETPVPDQNSVTTLLPVPEASESGFNVFDKYTQPFLYMGRQRSLDKYNADTSTSTYWKDIYNIPLTAFAYGDAQFPISYPNCRSVWGFHDDQGKNRESYSLLAWFEYDKSDLNSINTQILSGIKDILNKVRKDRSLNSSKLKTKAFFQEVQTIGWSFILKEFVQSGVEMNLDNIEGELDSIKRIVFYGASPGSQNPPPVDPKVSLAIGNNGVEALSAYLAGSTYQNDKKKKNELENKLEAIQFDFLKSMQVDLGAKFEEARHLKGFKAERGGMIWNYRIVSTDRTKELTPDQLAVIKSLEKENQHLFGLATELHKLNTVQTQYDHAVSTIHDKQQALFSDWYKYMLCAHPPMEQQDIYPKPDKALNYILESRIKEDLQLLMINTGKLNIVNAAKELTISSKVSIPTNEGFLIASSSDYLKDKTPQFSGSLANNLLKQLDLAKEKLLSFLTEPSLSKNKLTIYIYRKPAARYYAPTDPSILIAGNDVVPTIVNKKMPLLPCHLSSVTKGTSMLKLANHLLNKTTWLNAIKKEGKQILDWHPIMMEWEVAFYPIESTQNQSYKTGYLTSIYDLPPGQPDFKPIKEKNIPQSSSSISVYRGFSHLTPYALTYLDTKLEPYKTMLPNDPLYDAELANAAKNLRNQAVLSQALDGFNKAFIMQKQSLQLASIVDPVAMDAYKPLIKIINHFVDGNIGTAPLPNNDFNPIRGGGLNISQLNLVDSFGQKLTIYDYFKDNGQTKVHVPQTLSTDAPIKWKGFSKSVQAFLPPRFIQETRLHARWLSKDAEAIECGNHYKHSPICGWVVRNVMDDTIVLYDFAGNMLGSFGLVWISAKNYKVQAIPKPNAMTFVPDVEILNDHLKNFAATLLKLDENGFKDFFQVLTNAQEYTDPESFAQHPDLALLMGQPMALIRMRLNFERQGDYAYDEGWSAFENCLSGKSPLTDNYEAVQIPMRLGDYRQLNDGVIGYWDDGKNKSIDEDSIFYSPVKDFYSSPHFTGIDPSKAVKTEFYQNLKDNEQYFTLLFDPRGKLNITSGVLPVKTINIPPYLYQDSLKNIKVAFQMSPILTPKDQLQIPVPKEKGYQWNWVYPDVTTIASIQKDILNREWKKLYPTTTDIYTTLSEAKNLLQAEPLGLDIEYRPILEPLIPDSDQASIDFSLVNAENLYVLFPDTPNHSKEPSYNARLAARNLLGIFQKFSDSIPTRIAIHKDILNAQWKKLYPRSRNLYSRLLKPNRNYKPILEIDPSDEDKAFIHFHFVKAENLQSIFTKTSDQAKAITKQLLKILQSYGSNMATFPAQDSIQKTVLDKEWEKLYPDFGLIYNKLIKAAKVKLLNTDKEVEYQPILKPFHPESDQAYIKYDLLTSENMVLIFNTIGDQSKKPVEQLMQLLLKFHQGIDAVITDPQFEPVEIKEGWLELIEDNVER